MSEYDPRIGCGTADHWNRRTLLKAAGLSGLAWLTPLATRLARAAEKTPHGAPAKSVIMLWLGGGPSQLETFDPHPGTKIAAGSKARKTSVPGIQIGAGFEQLADQMHNVALVRSIISKEGDHERATYNVKTGFRPDPTLVHPGLGAVLCHQLSADKVDIPRHVSILPGQWPARGGYLGDQYDAFKINDPARPVPDVVARVTKGRFQQRLKDLRFVNDEFDRGQLINPPSGGTSPGSKNGKENEYQHDKTLHQFTINAALKMMNSDQLKAFEVKREPNSVRDEFGNTPFGRGCLAALRLITVGVRCVEVTLSGWDSHANNHEIHAGRIGILDPAFAALIRHLRKRSLFDSTIVLCGGEFGRTPRVNIADGRDHWPHGFSVALAGGGIRGGVKFGETSPHPKLDKKNRGKDVAHPVKVADVHATILDRLGIDFAEELDTPVNRPIKVSEGTVIKDLIASGA